MSEKDLYRIVGLTGGMGAGKSTLIKLVKEANIPVWDADAEVLMLYADPAFLYEINQAFGTEVSSKAEMAKAITEHPEYVERLNEISGPYLEASIEDFMGRHSDNPFVVMDAPLLFEAHWYELCDFVIAIQCPIEIRQARVMQRPGMTSAKMNLLMSRQISEADRLVRSHFIIHNDGDLKDSEAKMLSIIEHLREFYK